MVLLSLVASHRDLDLSVLERLSADSRAVGQQIVTGWPVVSGAVVLSTCNRFEVYLEIADATDVDTARHAAATVIAGQSGYRVPQVVEALEPSTGTAVVEHLFSVASGLESMVFGEREIAGQVRRALTAARREGTTTSALEALFQAASRTSRAVGSRTGLGAAGRTVVSVALDLAEQHLPAWHRLRCLLIGTGSYAGASLAAMKARGAAQITVYSASGRAGQFAAQRGVAAATADLATALRDVDLVVACSGSSGALLDAALVSRVRMGQGTDAPPLAVVDLALRHDVDPDVGDLPGVRLVSLSTVAEHAPHEHSGPVTAARAIVAEQAVTFESDRRTRDWDPPVVAERRRIMAELAAASAGLDERGARDLRRRVRADMHEPTVRARAAARVGDTATYAAALADLADLGVPAQAVPGRASAAGTRSAAR